MKPTLALVLLLQVAAFSAAHGGAGIQTPNQAATSDSAVIVANKDKTIGIPTEIWVALLGVVGTIGAALVGAYVQKRRSK